MYNGKTVCGDLVGGQCKMNHYAFGPGPDGRTRNAENPTDRYDLGNHGSPDMFLNNNNTVIRTCSAFAVGYKLEVTNGVGTLAAENKGEYINACANPEDRDDAAFNFERCCDDNCNDILEYSTWKNTVKNFQQFRFNITATRACNESDILEVTTTKITLTGTPMSTESCYLTELNGVPLVKNIIIANGTVSASTQVTLDEDLTDATFVTDYDATSNTCPTPPTPPPVSSPPPAPTEANDNVQPDEELPDPGTQAPMPETTEAAQDAAVWEQHNENCKQNPLAEDCCHHYEVDNPEASYPYNNHWKWYIVNATPTVTETFSGKTSAEALQACWESCVGYRREERDPQSLSGYSWVGKPDFLYRLLRTSVSDTFTCQKWRLTEDRGLPLSYPVVQEADNGNGRVCMVKQSPFAACTTELRERWDREQGTGMDPTQGLGTYTNTIRFELPDTYFNPPDSWPIFRTQQWKFHAVRGYVKKSNLTSMHTYGELGCPENCAVEMISKWMHGHGEHCEVSEFLEYKYGDENRCTFHGNFVRDDTSVDWYCAYKDEPAAVAYNNGCRETIDTNCCQDPQRTDVKYAKNNSYHMIIRKQGWTAANARRVCHEMCRTTHDFSNASTYRASGFNEVYSGNFGGTPLFYGKYIEGESGTMVGAVRDFGACEKATPKYRQDTDMLSEACHYRLGNTSGPRISCEGYKLERTSRTDYFKCIGFMAGSTDVLDSNEDGVGKACPTKNVWRTPPPPPPPVSPPPAPPEVIDSVTSDEEELDSELQAPGLEATEPDADLVELQSVVMAVTAEKRYRDMSADVQAQFRAAARQFVVNKTDLKDEDIYKVVVADVFVSARKRRDTTHTLDVHVILHEAVASERAAAAADTVTTLSETDADAAAFSLSDGTTVTVETAAAETVQEEYTAPVQTVMQSVESDDESSKKGSDFPWVPVFVPIGIATILLFGVVIRIRNRNRSRDNYDYELNALLKM